MKYSLYGHYFRVTNETGLTRVDCNRLFQPTDDR